MYSLVIRMLYFVTCIFCKKCDINMFFTSIFKFENTYCDYFHNYLSIVDLGIHLLIHLEIILWYFGTLYGSELLQYKMFFLFLHFQFCNYCSSHRNDPKNLQNFFLQSFCLNISGSTSSIMMILPALGVPIWTCLVM